MDYQNEGKKTYDLRECYIKQAQRRAATDRPVTRDQGDFFPGEYPQRVEIRLFLNF